MDQYFSIYLSEMSQSSNIRFHKPMHWIYAWAGDNTRKNCILLPQLLPDKQLWNLKLTN